MAHTHNATAGVETTVLTVEGMTCGSCVRHVTRALEGMTGVVDVQVNLPAKQAVVEHLPHWAGEAALVAAVKDAGYRAAVHSRQNLHSGQAPLPPLPTRPAGSKAGGCCCG